MHTMIHDRYATGPPLVRRIELIGGPHDGTRCIVLAGCGELLLDHRPAGAPWRRTRWRSRYIADGSEHMRWVGWCRGGVRR